MCSLIRLGTMHRGWAGARESSGRARLTDLSTSLLAGLARQLSDSVAPTLHREVKNQIFKIILSSMKEKCLRLVSMLKRVDDDMAAFLSSHFWQDAPCCFSVNGLTTVADKRHNIITSYMIPVAHSLLFCSSRSCKITSLVLLVVLCFCCSNFQNHYLLLLQTGKFHLTHPLPI